MQTLDELTMKVLPLIGRSIVSPRTANKGATGLLLETLTDIAHGPSPLDCTDGEVKAFPMKRDRQGKLVPKETIAMCMLSKEDLSANAFETSRPAKKMNRVLMVPYERIGDIITYLTPFTFRLSDHPDIAATLRTDYETIRARFCTDGLLTSRMGILLQNRTKGAGHGSTSRAFYLRKEFIRSVMPIHA